MNSPELKQAFQNTKVYNFVFGKVEECPTCHRTITTPDGVGFLKSEGVCISCEHVSGEIEDSLADNARDMLAEHEENHFNNGERGQNE